MKRKVVWTLLTFAVLVGASVKYAPSASSSSTEGTTAVPRVAATFRLLMPLATTLDVDRTDDTAAATACTAAPNDCSLRGAIIAANNDAGVMPLTINLQPATSYNLTLTNAAQENAAATGDLDIVAANHEVTINGGGSTVSAAGLNVGAAHDRVFQILSGPNNVTFADVTIADGRALDDGTGGASTVSSSQTTRGTGGCVLNNGGRVTLTNVTIQTCRALGRGDSIVNEHTTIDARGGGLASLAATGNVQITNSTLTDNVASGGDGGNFNNAAGSNAQGGAVYLEGGTLNIEGSRLEAGAANGGNGGNQNQNGQTNGGFGGTAQGGGVWVGGGTVTINNTTFEETEANGGNSGTGGNGANPGGGADGGGLYSLGNVTVTNSTFHLAEANGGDGGDAFGTTCLGGHSAGDGGGARGGAIFADGGSLVVNTATFANNSAVGGDGGDGGQNDGGALNCGNHGAGGLAHGGAIANNNAANVNLKHGTVSLNNAQAGRTGVNTPGVNKPPRLVAEGTGGGIRVGPGGVTLENTIIAGNNAANGTGDATGAPTPGPNVDGAVTSNGHNLLGTATEATGLTGTGDQTGADPLLAPLADNGGPTQTMALSIGSPAIDAGVAAGAAFDQRGRPRTFDDPGVANAATGDGTDIGAFELQPLCSLSCPADVTVSNDPDVCGAFVDYTEPSGAGCGTVTCDHPSGSFFALGETTVTCNSSAGPSCSFKVTVNDTQAPHITTGGPFTLWPPNHKYATFNVTDLVASVVDNCDVSVGVGGVRIKKVTSDEPDNSGGDGSTINDIVIAADCKSLKLRSERTGNGNGRVYTITLKVTDAAGNVGTATATVTVPHSQNGSPAVNDGPQYTVLSGCP